MIDKTISASQPPIYESNADPSPVYYPEDGASAKYYRIIAWLIWTAHFAFIARQKILVRRRSILEFDTLDTFAAVDVVVVSFLILILLCNGRTYQFLSRAYKSSVFWLLAYYLICAMSAVWSSRPAYSLYRSVEFLVFFVSLMVALSYCSGFEKGERKVLLLSLLSVFAQMGLHLRGGNVFSLSAWHTNAYTASAAVIFVYCIGEYLALSKQKLPGDRERRKMLFIYGCLSLILLALGTSSASNVAALFGVIVILFLLRKIALMLVIVYAAVTFFLIGGGIELLMDALFPGKTEQGIATLGGRTMIWKYYAERISESPVWGYGLGVLPAKGASAMAALTHNFVFSIFIGTGVMGFTVFLIFSAKLAAEMVRSFRKKTDGAIGVMGALAAGFVNSLSMPMIADRWATASFAFFSIFALFMLHVYPRSFDPAKPVPPERLIQSS